MFKGFNISVQGASHKEKEPAAVCQDFAGSHCTAQYGIAIVSDGHGSSKHFRSDKGSEIAVEVTKDAIIEFIEKDEYVKLLFETPDKTLKQLENNIIYRWNEAVKKHWTENPLPQDELDKFFKDKDIVGKERAVYGATLIAAVMTEKYWFAIQIGDGECVAVNGDESTNICIPGDDRLVFGYTTSLCDSNANENFRHYFSEGKPKGIIVSTDGVVDSFTEDGFENFNIKTLNLFMSQENALEQMEKFLPELSEKGSKDDVSIAGVFYVTEEMQKNTEEQITEGD